MKIESGRIVKAQGIKGEVKMTCLLDSPSQFDQIKQVYIGQNAYTVEGVRVLSDFFLILKLKEVVDRNTAESLVNSTVCVLRDDIIIASGRYFIDDLIGCAVFLSDGQEVGVLRSISQGKGVDVYTCVAPSRSVSFPFVADLPIEVDIQNKKIVLDKQRFGEVSVYAD